MPIYCDTHYGIFIYLANCAVKLEYIKVTVKQSVTPGHMYTQDTLRHILNANVEHLGFGCFGLGYLSMGHLCLGYLDLQ